jgi:hypothetical protein
VSPDDDERGERPKLSWSELDKRRDKPRSREPERGPRGAAAEARARGATQSYLAKLDEQLFAKTARGPGAGGRPGDAVRAALGTPGLTEACRAYHAALGAPREASLIGAFLDGGDAELRVAALDALAEEVAAGRIVLRAGLRAQLRMLADGPDDASAERAEAILGRR